MAHIFILDDDNLIRRLITETVGELGHQVDSASTLAEGMACCKKTPYDVIFLDILLPDGSGLDQIASLRDLPWRPEIVIITSHGNPEGAELAIKHGAWDYLSKPLSIENLILTVNRVVAFRQQRGAGHGPYRIKPAGIVGESRELKACLELVAQAAASDLNVLVLGETGTGKELFARAIHDHSRRASKPYVALDCASITESLLEARMFGHVKGSFTGAVADRDGVIALAHQGTLLLDEVGELPPSLQRSFLRVLETRRFRPIGATREVDSDFRLIAATNRNLREMTELDLYRKDLLYRLEGITITLPPLRRRPGDIPILCRHFLSALCQHYGECDKTLSDDVLETLSSHDWPGNVRELAHAVERSFAASRGEPVIFSGHLPLDIRMAVAKNKLERRGGGRTRSGRPPVAASGPAWQSFRDYREATEKSYLKGLLEQAASMTEAARLSGLSRGHLYQLLKKHAIPPSLD